jgi:hypothetical protein
MMLANQTSRRTAGGRPGAHPSFRLYLYSALSAVAGRAPGIFDFRFSIFDRGSGVARCQLPVASGLLRHSDFVIDSGVGFRPSSFRHRRGVTFPELMFAVILLGIGFIMLAAMFPVAIQQTRTTQEETAAAAIGASAVDMLCQLAPELERAGLLPPTTLSTWPSLPPTSAVPHGAVLTLGDPRFADTDPPGNPTMLWERIRGNLIMASDPRFAFVPFYSRTRDAGGAPARHAEFIVIVVQSRGQDRFIAARDVTNAPSGDCWLRGRIITVNLVERGPDADWVVVPNPAEAGPLTSGSFIVISDATMAATPRPEAHGRVYRLGRQVNPTTWELAPGYDMRSNAEDLSGARALIVGRDPRVVPYEGPAPDVAVFRAVVPLN